MANINDPALIETLMELGIKIEQLKDFEIIYYSPADKDENKKIYRKTNNKLLKILKQEKPDNYIHITGEMRALADPLHRKVCRELWTKYRQRLVTIFYFRYNHIPIGRDILKWNKRNWGDTSWVNHLAVFDLLSEGVVDLYSSPTLERIHYSIFDELILLQAKHKHRQHVKKVWLIKSESMSKLLLPKAREVLGKSKHIPPSIFKEYLLSISSPVSLCVLELLREERKIKKSDIYRELKMPRLFKLDDCILDLKAIDFIKEKDNWLYITNDGENYLNLFS